MKKFIAILSIAMLLLIGSGMAAKIALNQLNLTQSFNSPLHGVTNGTGQDAATQAQVSQANLSMKGYVDANDTLLDSNITDLATNVEILENTHSYLNVISGGPIGNHTLTGIHTDDILESVLYLRDDAYNKTTISDIWAEFTIIDTDTIHNTATNTTGGSLLVGWSKYIAPG